MGRSSVSGDSPPRINRTDDDLAILTLVLSGMPLSKVIVGYYAT
jgi:hypothetical protein